MASHSRVKAKLKQKVFGNSHHPLHIAIETGQKESSQFHEEDESFIISISATGKEFLADEPCLFACVTSDLAGLDSAPRSPLPGPVSVPDTGAGLNDTINIPNQEKGPDPILELFVSEVFLNHYNFHDNDVIWISPTAVFPIDKVVLAANTKRAFTWAKTEFFSTGILVSACRQKVLIRNNDVFLAPVSSIFARDKEFDKSIFQELHALECWPLSQGVLSMKTQVIILDQSDASKEVPIRTKYSNDTQDPVLISEFAKGKNLFPIKCAQSKISQRIPPKVSKSGELVENAWDSIQLNDISRERCLQKWLEKCPSRLDSNNTLVMFPPTAQRLGLFDESYVQLKVEEVDDPGGIAKEATKLDPNQLSQLNGVVVPSRGGGSHKSSKRHNRERIVQVKICSCNEWHQEQEVNSSSLPVVYASPTLIFHVVNRQSIQREKSQHILVKKWQKPNKDGHLHSTSCSSVLPFANEVFLAAVNSPNYSSAAPFPAAIQQYFTVPRIVRIGDIIPVSTKVGREFYQSSGDSTTHQPMVYLKIKKIFPKTTTDHTFLAVVGRTWVYQEGATHSYVPSVMDTLDQSHGLSTAAPPGLQEYTHAMLQLIQPYLFNREQCQELYPSVLLHGPAGCGKTAVTHAVAAQLHMHVCQVNCHDLCSDTSAATEAKIMHYIRRACEYSPCLLLLSNVEALGKDRDGRTEDSRVASYFHQEALKMLVEDSHDWPVVVIAMTSAVKHMTSGMHEGFLHSVEIESPDEETRTGMLSSLLTDVPCSSDVSLRRTAQRTAGLVLGDLQVLVARGKRAAQCRVVQLSCPGGQRASVAEEQDVCRAGVVLQQSDLDTALDQLQSAHSGAIGAPKIPNVTWEDVGGLAEVKADILDTIQLPLQHPELFAAGLRRSGVLLYGPPGTGKTLLAKAVATECSLNFLSVKGPELINMYVGQSEENVREVFSRARSATPCVIFFDELDSLAPNRGRSGDSGGVMDRVVSQLLAELDGLHRSCDVFVIGATNRPDLLDPALLRPGRFDKLLFLGVCDDRPSQLKIVKALTRKFSLSADCDLEAVVDMCPFNLTGADFYALCSDALLNAMKRKIDRLEAGDDVDQSTVEVTDEDFHASLQSLVPSVSLQELQRYKDVQHHFNARK